MGCMGPLDLSNTNAVMDFARQYDKQSGDNRLPMLGGMELVKCLRDVVIMTAAIDPDYDVQRRKGDLLEQKRVKLLELENEYLRLRLKQLARFDRRITTAAISFPDRRTSN